MNQKKILSSIRKELGIPEDLPKKYYKLLKNEKVWKPSAFITNDSEGNVFEVVLKEPPYIKGELLYLKLKNKSFSSSKNNSS